MRSRLIRRLVRPLMAGSDEILFIHSTRSNRTGGNDDDNDDGDPRMLIRANHADEPTGSFLLR